MGSDKIKIGINGMVLFLSFFFNFFFFLVKMVLFWVYFAFNFMGVRYVEVNRILGLMDFWVFW